MQETTIIDHIKTAEFPLAVTLLNLGFPIQKLETDATTPSRTIFVFKYSQELEATIDAYWNDGLLIEPKAFFGTTRELKSRMKSTVYGDFMSSKGVKSRMPSDGYDPRR